MAKYRDIDLNFTRNPVTNDVSIVEDANAVKAAVRNIVLTNFGERPFNPDIGSGIRRLLFEPLSPITAAAIQTKIENSLENFEPRIELLEINVVTNLDNNSFDVSIGFRMSGDNRPVFVPITLKRLR